MVALLISKKTIGMAKAKGKAPAFQWYPADILSSARVAELTLAEEGGYRRAIDYCWLNGSLPVDNKRLAGVIGKNCSVGMAEKIKTLFIPHPTDPTRIIHERLEQERAKQAEWSEKSRNGGKRSAELRASQISTTVATVVEPKVNQEVNQSATLHLQSSSSPLENISSSSKSENEISENVENLESEEKKNNDVPPEKKLTKVEILKQAYPIRIQNCAKKGGMPPEAIEEELKNWAEHHAETQFTDVVHMVNSWNIWCQNYYKKTFTQQTSGNNGKINASKKSGRSTQRKQSEPGRSFGVL